MSALPPDDPPPIPLNYETPQPHGQNASMLVRLAAIFNFVAGGFDLLNVCYHAAMLILMLYLQSHPGAGGAPLLGRGRAPPPPAPPGMMTMQIVMQAAPAALSLVAAAVKLLAATWLLRRSRGAWGLGLAAAIFGCLEFWSCPCCFLHVAAAIYTIIILCFTHVRVYLGTSAV